MRAHLLEAPAPPRTPLESEHSHDPLAAGESARIWQSAELPDVELLHGKYRTFSFARHFHDAIAIGVVETGSMRTYCQGRVHVVPAGNVILLNPGDVHAPHPGAAGGWSFRMFYLERALVQTIANFDGSHGFAQPFLDHAALYNSLLRMHRRFELDPNRLEAESWLTSGLAAINRHAPWTKEPRLPAPGRAKILRARDYLQAHCLESVSIRQLSAITELSPYHLVRSFQAQVGLTPHAFLLQLRIERSRHLLSTGVSIAEAALHVGFVDQSHFTRLFKRFTGVTPAKYLREGNRTRLGSR